MELKEYLEVSGIKQNHFAKKAKVTTHTISKLKSGKEINLSTAIRICRATHGQVTPEDLYNTLFRKNMNDSKDHKNGKKPRKNKHNAKVGVSP